NLGEPCGVSLLRLSYLDKEISGVRIGSERDEGRRRGRHRGFDITIFTIFVGQMTAPDTLSVGYGPERRELGRRLQGVGKKKVWCVVDFGVSKTRKCGGKKKNKGESSTK